MKEKLLSLSLKGKRSCPFHWSRREVFPLIEEGAKLSDWRGKLSYSSPWRGSEVLPLIEALKGKCGCSSHWRTARLSLSLIISKVVRLIKRKLSGPSHWRELKLFFPLKEKLLSLSLMGKRSCPFHWSRRQVFPLIEEGTKLSHLRGKLSYSFPWRGSEVLPLIDALKGKWSCSSHWRTAKLSLSLRTSKVVRLIERKLDPSHWRELKLFLPLKEKLLSLSLMGKLRRAHEVIPFVEENWSSSFRWRRSYCPYCPPHWRGS